MKTSDYIKISIFGVSLTALWSSLHSIILPIRVSEFVAEEVKNSHLGLLTFLGLIIAMFAQPFFGALSDRFSTVWGKRRIYIVTGALLALITLPFIGLADGFVSLTLVYCLLQLTCNVAQGPFQAFIPDMVPANKHGVASGVKSLMEIIGGFAAVRLIAFFMGKYTGIEQTEWLWFSIGTIGILIIGATALTFFLVKEERSFNNKQPSGFIDTRTIFRFDIRSNTPFLWFVLSRLLFIMSLTTIQAFALYYVNDVMKLPNASGAVGDLMIASAISMIVVVYPAGRISDRTGRKPLLYISGGIGIAGILILLLLNNYASLLICGAMVGVSTGTFMSSSWAMATDLVPKGEEAKFLGLTNFATAGGSALAKLIGYPIDYLNTVQFGLGYTIMLIGCMVYYLIGTVVLLKIKVPSPK